MAEENPLYPTKEEAYTAPGEIYQHYKGGVYRLVRRDVLHTETGELGVVYEHLWPHNHGFWFRPQEHMPAPYHTQRIVQFWKDIFYLANPRFWLYGRTESFGAGFFEKNEKGEERFKLIKKS